MPGKDGKDGPVYEPDLPTLRKQLWRGPAVIKVQSAGTDVAETHVIDFLNATVVNDDANHRVTVDTTTAIPPNTYVDTTTAQTVAGKKTYTADAVFRSGVPRYDVTAYGAFGDGTTHPLSGVYGTLGAAQAVYPSAQALTDEFDLVAFERVVGLASLGTSAANKRIHHSAGKYLWNRKPNIPNSLSNVKFTGDGYWTSLVKWTGGNDDVWYFRNPKGVEIEDMGLLGNSDPAKRPNSMVRFHRTSGQVGGSSATECRMDRVWLGDAGTDQALRGVEFSADAGQDGNNDLGHFNEVFMYGMQTGYRFGTLNGIWHNIIGGAIYSATVACIDNTPSGTSVFGGSYTAVGVRFIGNTLVFRYGRVGNGDTDIVGCKGEANTQLIDTPATLQANDGALCFHGGSFTGGVGAGGDSTKWDSNGPELEFHRTKVLSAQVWNFPGSAAVRFFGGESSTTQWKYNGTVVLAEHTQNPGATLTNLGSGVFRVWGGSSNGLTGGTGTTAGVHTLFTAYAGTGATVTVDGTSLAGQITITAGTGVAAGPWVQIDLHGYLFPRVMMHPISAYAKAYKGHFDLSPVGGGFTIDCDTVATDSQVYTFDYIAVGS